MANPIFEKPILNSPYDSPQRHWELDAQGQPTQQIIENRRRAEFITPIPKPRKRRGSFSQPSLVFDEGKGLSTQQQQYDPTSIINEVRGHVDRWRALPLSSQWQVTPETTRLRQHWRHHQFSGVRPFFCQVEALETAIWLTEVARESKTGKRFLDHLDAVNKGANPELLRLALKLATGAGKTTVMAMLIAWETINAVRRPGSKRFTRGFFVVAGAYRSGTPPRSDEYRRQARQARRIDSLRGLGVYAHGGLGCQYRDTRSWCSRFRYTVTLRAGHRTCAQAPVL